MAEEQRTNLQDLLMRVDERVTALMSQRDRAALELSEIAKKQAVQEQRLYALESSSKTGSSRKWELISIIVSAFMGAAALKLLEAFFQ